MTARRVLDLIFTGALWGGLAVLLGGRAIGRPIWGAALASPVIAVIVGALLQGRFERQSGSRRIWIALLSLYLGATLFGLAVGIADWPGLTATGSRPLENLAEAVLSVWWGVTITGFLLFLWPLAYGTHWMLEWRDSYPPGQR